MFVPEGFIPAVHMRRGNMPEINLTKEGKDLAHPAPKAPRIFADTADIDAIKTLFEAGIINGVTTNPTLMKRAGASSWDQACGMMKDICDLMNPHPVSLELTELTYDGMVTQAEELRKLGDNSVIKVPVGGYQAIDKSYDPHTGLKVLHALWERDIQTNATLIFNSSQAFWAANAGASYVSPFMARISAYCYQNDEPELPEGNALYNVVDMNDMEGTIGKTDNTEYVARGGARKDAGSRLVREIVSIFAGYDIRTEVLAASIRNMPQVMDCLMAGADIITVPAPILARVADHPLSSEGMVSFLEDSKAFKG